MLLLSSLVSSSICLMLVLYPRPICFTSDHIHCWVWGSVFQREFFFWGLAVFGGTSYSFWKRLWGENREAGPALCLSGWTEEERHGRCSMDFVKWRKERGKGMTSGPRGVRDNSATRKDPLQSFTFYSLGVPGPGGLEIRGRGVAAWEPLSHSCLFWFTSQSLPGLAIGQEASTGLDTSQG